ncbi:DUF5055 domain-containing protein [Catenibacterium mitsuokai]|jgi:hypothetical protein|uniref:DUF5055 domain-containing protein n=1 Tax=Catenibacterium mitsuokai TaxID=100886 RepID=UPI002926C831|nr:hypothetical protein AUSP0056_00053 [uncultured phage]
MEKTNSTTIKFAYEGKNYELGYTREIVGKMVGEGFEIEKAAKNPLDAIYELFINSFEMNHQDTDINTREKILKNLGNKEHLFAVLVEMFSEPIEFLGEPEKNAIEWTV